MYNLLRMHAVEVAERVQPELKRNFENNKLALDKVKTYHRSGGHKVNSSHVALSAMYHIHTNEADQTIADAYRRAKEGEFKTAHGLGISTSSKSGEVFRKDFFNTETIVVLDRTSLKYVELSDMMIGSNFRKFSPIKVLRAPRTWNPLNLPNGDHNFDNTDLAVVSINIGMLGAMYFAWKKEQGKLADGKRESIKEFVSYCIMTNMQDSTYTACIINMYLSILKTENVELDDYKGSVWAVGYSESIRFELADLVENINSQAAGEYKGLLALPVDQTRHLIDIVPNLHDLSVLQNKWYEYLYLEDLVTIISLFAKKKEVKMSGFNNRAKRIFKRLFSNNSFNRQPKEFNYDIKTMAMETVKIFK